MRKLFFRAVSFIKRSLRMLAAHRYTTIAGTLVFFLIMSLVPLLFWLVILFGRTGLDAAQIFEIELFGWAKELLIFLKNNAEGASAGAGVLFLLTTFWSGSSFFYHLRRSGEIIYGYRRTQRGWKIRLAAIIFTLFLLVFFFGAAAVLVGANYFGRVLPKWIFYVSSYSLILSLGFFAAWALNLYICPYRVSPADTATGSFLTALAWLIASAAFAIYLRFASPERLYGALALFIVFLLWLYWMMICFTAGVIYNRHKIDLKERIQKSF